ncbi:holo-ACP synthase [Enterococcus hirae]|nr:holo-ACP synthase [Enterococcaceae bacterium]MCI1919444.1 holo-ACP synthase [Enterococcaceae bacterium]MDM8213621.1 holo-ACP synthase [Enterococcus hirae]
MIRGIGIDLVDLKRINKIIERKPLFIKRTLTPREFSEFSKLERRRQIEYLGGRFACKEAFSKAWGTGIGKVGLQEIETLTNDAGAPIMTMSPFEGIHHVSITHTKDYAMAEVILEERG